MKIAKFCNISILLASAISISAFADCPDPSLIRFTAAGFYIPLPNTVQTPTPEYPFGSWNSVSRKSVQLQVVSETAIKKFGPYKNISTGSMGFQCRYSVGKNSEDLIIWLYTTSNRNYNLEGDWSATQLQGVFWEYTCEDNSKSNSSKTLCPFTQVNETKNITSKKNEK